MKKPKAEAIKKMGKPPITVKWVDVNKGDELRPYYRSRIVAKEFRSGAGSKWDFFTATPPLESLR